MDRVRMSQRFDDAIPSAEEFATVLRQAGLSGAGGGGFPTYAKWQSLSDVEYLLVNHQESEPNSYMDKWIGCEYATELADLFDTLLSDYVEGVVIGAKQKDRDPWLHPLEDATDATVYLPDDLPLDPESASGVTIAYTDNTYEFGMENVLLQQIAGVVIGKDLPIDYGWIIQNTETIYNAWRALELNEPITHKFVHVDGYRADGSRMPNKLFKAPIGTSAAALYDAAGVDPAELASDRTLVEGGPGWCFKVQRPADRYGVTKHTNTLMLLDEETVAENTFGNGRINVLDSLTWSIDDPDIELTPVDPERVHIPIVTNETYGDLIAQSTPLVEYGDEVSGGQAVAEPSEDANGFSIAHHSPFAGEVSDVTPREVEVRSYEHERSDRVRSPRV